MCIFCIHQTPIDADTIRKLRPNYREPAGVVGRLKSGRLVGTTYGDVEESLRPFVESALRGRHDGLHVIPSDEFCSLWESGEVQSYATCVQLWIVHV